MSRIIDLSYDITEQLQVFPNDPEVRILRHHNYENGYFVSQITLGTHTGTHIDVSVHCDRKGKTVDDVPIDMFINKAFVMDLTYLKPLEEINPVHLNSFAEKVDNVRAIIIKTGWGSHFGKEDFFVSFPGIGEEAVSWLFDKGIDLIGLESPSVNAKKHQKIHMLLFERGIGIVESLANVEKISSEYVQLYAVPLKLKGLDGSPVRAFALEV